MVVDHGYRLDDGTKITIPLKSVAVGEGVFCLCPTSPSIRPFSVELCLCPSRISACYQLAMCNLAGNICLDREVCHLNRRGCPAGQSATTQFDETPLSFIYYLAMGGALSMLADEEFRGHRTFAVI